MKKTSFSKKIQAEQTMLVQLIRSYDAERNPIYVYISLSGSNALKLESDIVLNASVDLEKYGTIIASGLGHTPPLLVQKKIGELYSIPHSQ